MKLLYKSFAIKIKAVDEAKYRIKAIFSTPMEDRHGEVIDQTGWKLDEFLKNPVVLFAHNQFEPAIAKVISLGINDGNLEEIVVNQSKEPVWVYHKKYGWLRTNIFMQSEEAIENYSSIIARRVSKQTLAGRT